MSYGYTARVIDLNKGADQNMLGVQLGALCIAKDIPVAEVSGKLGVSRQTAYNWFTGANSPRGAYAGDVEKLMQAYNKNT